jgi:hypothetical protein
MKVFKQILFGYFGFRIGFAELAFGSIVDFGIIWLSFLKIRNPHSAIRNLVVPF